MKIKHGKIKFVGNGPFSRYAEFYNANKFCEVRNWCWEQWGPSSEFEIYQGNRVWCWIRDNQCSRILFTSDKEYTLFLLKWG